MIISIFIILLLISLVVTFLGYFAKDTGLQISGLAFLFILGGVMANIPVLNGLTGSLEYVSGENISTIYKYGNNYSSYHWDYMTNPPTCANPTTDIACVNLFHTYDIKINLYSEYNDPATRFIGVFLMIASIIAITLIFTRLKQE